MPTHELAFTCVEKELGRDFAEHVTREPRYGRNSATGSYSLTNDRMDSLVPDLVIHFVRNAMGRAQIEPGESSEFGTAGVVPSEARAGRRALE